MVETVHKVIKCLEDGRSAVSILSIDFSKAFNCMCHRTCINELSLCGASSESIAMVLAFLDRRHLQVKVNEVKSSLRHVKGGSPQGTWLGNILFTVTIEAIEEINGSLSSAIPNHIRQPVLEAGYTRPSRFVARPISGFAEEEFNMSSTPVKCGTFDGMLRYHDHSGRFGEDLTIGDVETPPEDWMQRESWTDKYVDDANTGEHHYLPCSSSHLTTEREKKDHSLDGQSASIPNNQS